MVFYFRSFSSRLEASLNVLAHGLETNKDSTLLWQCYLSLYSKHHDVEQLPLLYQQAIQYAPSYYIYHKVRYCPRRSVSYKNH